MNSELDRKIEEEMARAQKTAEQIRDEAASMVFSPPKKSGKRRVVHSIEAEVTKIIKVSAFLTQQKMQAFRSLELG